MPRLNIDKHTNPRKQILYEKMRKKNENIAFLKKMAKIFIYIILTISSIALALPMIWLFILALTPEIYLTRVPPLISVYNFSFENFRMLFKIMPLFGMWFVNTFYIAVLVAALSVFLNALAGYSFAKLKFKGRSFLFWLLLSTLMVPAQLTVIPIFIIFTQILHLKDTHLAIILPQLSAPLGIFLMKQYIENMPGDFEDSARLDGCGEFGIFFYIILPLSKPILAVWAIFVFVANWKNFFWPLIILDTERKFLIEIGLSTLQKQFTVNQGLVMAGAALATLPVLILFLCFQKQFSHSMMMTEIK